MQISLKLEKLWNSKFFFFLGLFIVVFYSVGSQLYSISKIPAGTAWIPFNTQHKYCSDIGFYGAVTQEYRESFWSFKNPIKESEPPIYYDVFRSASHRLAALLTFFIPDHRYGLFLSLSLGVALQFILLFLLFFKVSQSRLLSCIGSLIVIFLSGMTIPYQELPTIFFYLFNSSGSLTLDTLGSHFRYVSLHTAVILMWTHFFCAWVYHEKRNYFSLCLFAFSLFLAVYSYYPFTFVAALYSGLFWLASLKQNRDRILIKHLILFTLINLVLCLATNTFTNVIDLANSKYLFETIVQSHFENTEQANTYTGVMIITTIYSLILAVFSFLLLLKKGSKVSIVQILPLTLFLIYAGAIITGQSFMIYRFQTRGLSSVMAFSIVLSLLATISMIKFKWITHVISIAMIGVFGWFAFYAGQGYLRMSEGLYLRESYYMPQSDWDMYDYIRKNIPTNTPTIVLEPGDNYLVPVYTDVDMIIYDNNFSTQTMGQNIDRLLSAIHFLKITDERFFKILADYKVYGQNYLCPPIRMSTSYRDNFSHHFVNQFFYIPFIRQAYGVNIYDFTKRAFTEDFLGKLKQQLASEPIQNWTPEKGTLLLVDYKSPIYETASLVGFELIFRTETKGLYKFSGTH